jgi:predicted membrane chloride channel (bestrophin family)
MGASRWRAQRPIRNSGHLALHPSYTFCLKPVVRVQMRSSVVPAVAPPAPQDVTQASSMLAVPFNLTTFALSLLLVFRTNSSYSRWWEARMVWGAVVNLSRNFARQVGPMAGLGLRG